MTLTPCQGASQNALSHGQASASPRVARLTEDAPSATAFGQMTNNAAHLGPLPPNRPVVLPQPEWSYRPALR